MTDRTQAFDEIASYYKDARPTYPDDLVGALAAAVTHLPPTMSRVAVDVGAGTGIATRQLAEALGSTWSCLAIEPGAAMRELARTNLSPLGIDVLDGRAEHIPMRDDSAGLLLAAQAVQWFDRSEFYAEAARVLAPGGRLALLENNRSWRTSPFLDAYEVLLEEWSPGYSRFYRDFDYATELNYAGFTDVEAKDSLWVRTISAVEFERLSMSSTKMRAVVDSIGESRARGHLSELLRQYAAQDTVEVPYCAELLIAVNGALP